MKRNLLLIFSLCLVLGLSAQPWSYDFGTSLNSYTGNNTTTQFFPNTPSGGGTYRLRTVGNGGFYLKNPGTSLGAGSELQLNGSAIGDYPNKFGVYNYNNASLSAYVKFKFRTSSNTSGFVTFALGDAMQASNVKSFVDNKDKIFASFIIRYDATGNVTTFMDGLETTSLGVFLENNDYEIEVYANNRSVAQSYKRSEVTETISIGAYRWHIWIRNITANEITARRIGGEFGSCGLPGGVNLDGFTFTSRNSPYNGTWLYLDDLFYNPKLLGNVIIATNPATNVLATSATMNGTIVSDAGVGGITEKGFYYSTINNFTLADYPTNVVKVTDANTSYVDGSTIVKDIAGLAANTTYYYRAYVVQNGFTNISGQMSFTTNASASVGFYDPDNITQTISSIDFGTAYNDQFVTKSFYVKGINFTSDLTLTSLNPNDYIFTNGTSTRVISAALVNQGLLINITLKDGTVGSVTGNIIATYNSAPIGGNITLTAVNKNRSFSFRLKGVIERGTQTVEVSAADFPTITQTYDILSDGVFSFTQALPNRTYTVKIGSSTYSASTAVYPTFANVPLRTAVAVSGEDHVNIAYNAIDTVPSAVQIDNMKLNVVPTKTFVNNASSLSVGREANDVNFEAKLVINDGLCVEMDFSNFNNPNGGYAFITLPFDVDVRTGIRKKNGTDNEAIAVFGTDYMLYRYDPAKRAQNGEGQNWTQNVDGNVLRAGQGVQMVINGATVTDNVIRFYATNPQVLSAQNKSLAVVYTSSSIGSWNESWNFMGLPLTSKHLYTPNEGEIRYLYRRVQGGFFGGYKIVDYRSESLSVTDKVLDPYVPYFFQTTSDINSISFPLTKDRLKSITKNSIRSSFIFNLIKAGERLDYVGLTFNDDASTSYVINEDAYKMGGTVENTIWSEMNGARFAFNELPYDPQSTIYKIKAQIPANTEGYVIELNSSVFEGYSINIREANGDWSQLSTNGYQIQKSSAMSRTFEVQFSKITTDSQIIPIDNVLVSVENLTINIETKGEKVDALSIFDSLGRLVVNGVVGGGNKAQYTMPSSGIYLLQINKQFVKLIVK